MTGKGIHTSGVSSIAVLNSGIVESDGTGILVDRSFGQSLEDSSVSVTNDGGAIISETSAVDGADAAALAEESGERGIAIDVSDAPHPALIDLIGDNPDGLGALAGNERLSSFLQDSVLSGVDNYGYVVGDIITEDDDTIVVENGVTVFDGVVNPDEALEGDLELDETGKLVMVQNLVDGPSAAFVDHFEHELGGNLVYELTPIDVGGRLSDDRGQHGQYRGDLHRHSISRASMMIT